MNNSEFQPSKTKHNMTDSNKGYTKILSLTDEELIGTLCLEPRYREFDSTNNTFTNCQSDRFLAALFDKRTSFKFKSNEIFHIVEPQHLEYEQFAVKLKLKNHLIDTVGKEDIKCIKAYLDECNSQHCFTVLMRPDLNISQILSYLNEVGTLKSDREIDDYTSRINSERLPRFLIAIETPEFFRIFCKLLNFYSNTIEAKTNYTSPQKLIGKVIQRQDSKYIDIKGTIPHRNCVYFIQKNDDLKGFFKMEFNRVIDGLFLKYFTNVHKKVDYDNSAASDDKYFTVYDMECANDKINLKENDKSFEKDPDLPKYSK
ncbi:hypothetical protein BN7_6782 [Wickerhamomyces ciferrii]|uniref:Uncharacterized protein n=1 Tax=Wickerhamomyces ciferrii (strain ATCC 14091 / BCRC 22168 / CBS 111 / JCM 3599 / NBRC 0793 / NRRL Y-1031 F-60-10) TaxID=1206466 RepID=K0KYL2_WICCF|nr:uncharacterized protein BN7_6782 [Wickerhamomyces ciferrii]CCH47162.1 hypothetical protein BN7_6782 [Wickerhamomyces ciferrii]